MWEKGHTIISILHILDACRYLEPRSRLYARRKLERFLESAHLLPTRDTIIKIPGDNLLARSIASRARKVLLHSLAMEIGAGPATYIASKIRIVYGRIQTVSDVLRGQGRYSRQLV